MAAIQRTRISSSVGGAFVVAVSAALLVGGTGGYVARALTSHASASAQYVVTRPALDNEDLTQSDLTRVQPPSAEVPAWVKKYTETGQASQFKVDEFIASLGYARAAAMEPSRPMRGGLQQ